MISLTPKLLESYPYSRYADPKTIQRGHAIANFVHVAVANRVGTEGEVTFWGNSFVANAFGKLIKKAGTKEQVLIADLDISQNARIREGWPRARSASPTVPGTYSTSITRAFRRRSWRRFGSC